MEVLGDNGVFLEKKFITEVLTYRVLTNPNKKTKEYIFYYYSPSDGKIKNVKGLWVDIVSPLYNFIDQFA